MLLSSEENSLSKEDFLSKLELINDQNIKKLFVFILQYAYQQNRQIVCYYDEYCCENNNNGFYTVLHIRYTIKDGLLEEMNDKLQSLRNYISDLDMDAYLILNDCLCSNYSVELLINVENPEKSKLVINNTMGKLQCKKEFQDLYQYSLTNTKEHKLFMYNDIQPYIDRGGKRCFPMSMKYIFGIFDNSSFDMLSVLLKWYSQYGIVFKDILTDYQNGCTDMPPFSLNDIMTAHNRRELLEIKLKKVTTRKKDNNIPLLQSYYIHKAEKYINENDLQILYQIPFEIFLKLVVSVSNENQRVKYLLENYYTEILYSGMSIDKYYIRDYVKMCFDLKEKVRLQISYKKLKSEHNRLALRYDRKKLHQFTIPDTTLSKLKLPKEFVRITGKRMLLEEATVQHHCVASYADKISQGKCLIYTTVYQEKRYTIEIVFSRKKFVVRQIRGVYNSLPPNSLPKELKKLLADETARINNKLEDK